ncbi:11034_t:CDS:2 [Acaulospora colombiana]|uniref:11034_t:CDS:1 n=1 Tax=Acaulospora colombiana TaxID=27376 RepID=A0ACA9K1Q6_9GLOM|nr:11034_t:CDS:2 [Acaulospora colombiana]
MQQQEQHLFSVSGIRGFGTSISILTGGGGGGGLHTTYPEIT